MPDYAVPADYTEQTYTLRRALEGLGVLPEGRVAHLVRVIHHQHGLSERGTDAREHHSDSGAMVAVTRL